MGFDFDTTAEDIKVFLDEAEELLQLMEADILKLEKESDNPEHLKEIFRAAHTLKGSSATLGHKKMAEVTHSMENVLDKLRKGKLKVSTDVVNTLFACLDVFKAFKQEIASGEESAVTTEAILARLAAIDDARSTVARAAVQSPGQLARAQVRAAPSAGLPVLSPMEENRVQEGIGRGLIAMWAQLVLDKNAPMPAVRAFQAIMAIGDVGELVRSWPTQEDVEEDKVGEELKLVFVTGQTLAQVSDVLEGIPELQVTELALLPAQGTAPSQPQAAAAALAEAHPATASATERDATAVAASRAAGRNSTRTVRVDVEVLDNLMSLVGELVIDRTRLMQVLTQVETRLDGDDLIQVMSSALAHIGRMTSDLQDEIQRARMLPVENLFKKFPRMVRDTAQKAGKEIEFVVRGEETELDRSVIEEIGDPLMHLIRNAVDHGVEPPADRVIAGKSARGVVILEAFHEENHIIISVRDDGRGVNPALVRASAVRKGLMTAEAARRMTDLEVINLIWAPGFSTAERVSDISGRGVGLDVVHKNIEKLNGSVEIKSEVGKGTEFRVKLPLTLAIIRSLQVEVMGTTYCIPLGSVVETDRLPLTQIQTIRQRSVIVKRGEVIPLVRLLDAFQMERPEGYAEPEEIFVVIVSVTGRQIGLVVDNLIGESEVVIKPLGKFIGDVPGVSGATIMGDGDVAIILDISSLINTVQAELNRAEAFNS